MNTIATEEQSAVVDRAPRRGKNFNLRAYVAGGAATAMLIAAGIVVFGSLAAYVAFNGLPVGGGDEGGDSVAVQAAGAGAPTGALGAAAGAVAATAATATAIAPAAAGGGDGAPGTGGAPPTDGTLPPVTPGTPPGTPTPGTGTTPGSGGDAAGPVGNAVQGVDNAAGNAGLDLPLTETTDPITGPVDDTVQGTLDQAGGAVGQPGLGQQVGGAVSGLTDRVLGGE